MLKAVSDVSSFDIENDTMIYILIFLLALE